MIQKRMCIVNNFRFFAGFVCLSLVFTACAVEKDDTMSFRHKVDEVNLADDVWDGHAISYSGYRANQSPDLQVYPSKDNSCVDGCRSEGQIHLLTSMQTNPCGSNDVLKRSLSNHIYYFLLQSPEYTTELEIPLPIWVDIIGYSFLRAKSYIYPAFLTKL